VPAVAAGVAKDPGVAPGFVVPYRAVETLVPARVCFTDRSAPDPLPVGEVVGDGVPDALDEALLRAGGAGVEQVPVAVFSGHYGARPGRVVVPGGTLGRGERVGEDAPSPPVVGDGVSDRRVEVAFVGIAESLGGLEEEQVVFAVVGDGPRVPDPVFGECEH
jgi:hypothetical protein